MSKYSHLADTAPANPDHGPVRIAVVVSRYNALITERLYEGAEEIFRTHAAKGSSMVRVDAPGSFELPALCLAAAATQSFDGVVALGCIIKGDTIHDRVIADAIATGIINATLASGVPIAFGVITAENEDQALARAGGAVGNKGSEAMSANLETIAAIRGLAMSHVNFDDFPSEAAPLPERKASKKASKKSAKKSAKKSGKNAGKKSGKTSKVKSGGRS